MAYCLVNVTLVTHSSYNKGNKKAAIAKMSLVHLKVLSNLPLHR